MSRILVVEDDEATRYAMARTLDAAGYEVALAHDYHDALPILQGSDQVDLLLVDLLMTGVNAFALARMAHLRRRNLRVVYVTGYADIPVSEPMGSILRKPIMPDTLLEAIHKVLPISA